MTKLDFFRQLKKLALEECAGIIAVDFEFVGGQLKLTFRSE